MLLHIDSHWISPYAFSTFVALKEKGVPFATKEIAFDKLEQHQGDYPAKSFTARVPSLIDGDFWLAESSAIVEYLEEKFSGPKHPPLFPISLEERALARMTMAFIRSDLMALREERPTTTMFYEKAKTPLSPAGAKAAEKLIHFAERILPQGKTSLFTEWSIADADLAFMLQRLCLNGHEVPKRIGDFVEKQWARASVREFVEHNRRSYSPY